MLSALDASGPASRVFFSERVFEPSKKVVTVWWKGEVWLKFLNKSCLVWLRNTVDGRNPAPVDMVNIPGGAGFLPSTAWTTISWYLENLNPSEILKLNIWSHFSSQLVPVAQGMDHPCKPLTTLTYDFDIFWPFTYDFLWIFPDFRMLELCWWSQGWNERRSKGDGKVSTPGASQRVPQKNGRLGPFAILHVPTRVPTCKNRPDLETLSSEKNLELNKGRKNMLVEGFWVSENQSIVNFCEWRSWLLEVLIEITLR